MLKPGADRNSGSRGGSGEPPSGSSSRPAMPQIDTARSTFVATYPLGPFAVVVFTRCASKGPTEYVHAALVVDREGALCFAVTAESTSSAEPPALRVYPGQRPLAGAIARAFGGRPAASGPRPILLGDSPDYWELEAFTACALQLIQEHFPTEGRLPVSAPSGSAGSVRSVPAAPPTRRKIGRFDRASVYAFVESWLKEQGFFYEPSAEGAIWLRFGTVLIEVRVWDWKWGTVVMLTAPVARKCRRLSPELGLYLLVRNAELLFGRFSVHQEAAAVAYEHALAGNYLDPEELQVALALVAQTAQEHESQIAQMAGGERIVEDSAG